MPTTVGLIIVYTGQGKGKTTASLGLALRAAGWGKKVLILQFIKGTWLTGELKIGRRLKNLEIETQGEGFVKIMGDRKPFFLHRKAAHLGYQKAKKAIRSGKYDLIILDEINVAVKEKLLKPKQLLALIKIKPEKLHLVFTGRGATKALIKKADLVTEMKEIKHPYKKGRLAEAGIDF